MENNPAEILLEAIQHQNNGEIEEAKILCERMLEIDPENFDGMHLMGILMGQYEILGETLDDAAGEAFDKTAKLLGLGYPGGPALARLAETGNHKRFHFPRPMTDRPGLDFSFSGLKTFALNTLKAQESDDQTRADIAAAFQQAVVDTLLIKCRRALEQTGMNRLVIAGGVSANQLLRERFNTFAQDKKIEIFYPRLEFCTDNGAMIAFAGFHRLKLGQREDLTFKIYSRWPIDHL